jgi:hypothetical protein
MRALLLSLLFALLVVRTSDADDKERLYGVWKLTSFKIQVVEDASPPKDVWGPNPKGYLILTPEGRTMTILMAANRKPATNDAESAALLKSMNAYSGTYTIEGDRWTTIVDLHHNEIYIAQPPQVRYFKLAGDKLTVKVPEQPSAIFPGKHISATLEWIRER